MTVRRLRLLAAATVMLPFVAPAAQGQASIGDVVDYLIYTYTNLNTKLDSLLLRQSYILCSNTCRSARQRDYDACWDRCLP